jgi:hypothetical protein
MAGETGHSELRAMGRKAVKIESIPERWPFAFKPTGFKRGKSSGFLQVSEITNLSLAFFEPCATDWRKRLGIVKTYFI